VQHFSVSLVTFLYIALSCVHYVIFTQQYGKEALWHFSLCTTNATGLVVHTTHVEMEHNPAQDSSWRVMTGTGVREKYSRSIVQVDLGQSKWETGLESTTHINEEGGWAVRVQTVLGLPVLEHPPHFMDFRIVITGCVAMERYSKYTQEERALVVTLLLMMLSCCFTLAPRAG